LLGRDGYPLDMNRILDTAVEYDVAIELNASPYRCDLDWRNCKIAKEKGVMISVNPDAHSVSGLHDMDYGIGIARKGWLEKENVLNTKTLSEIETYFIAKKNRV
jgi:DNA polymerase (family 10)